MTRSERNIQAGATQRYAANIADLRQQALHRIMHDERLRPYRNELMPESADDGAHYAWLIDTEIDDIFIWLDSCPK